MSQPQQLEYSPNQPPPKPKRVKAGGRKKGTPNRRRTYAMVGADGGIPPIDVILHHMRWYHEQAEAVYKKVQVASKLVKDQKTLKRFMALLEELGDYRQLAIAAAEKAAPYCHHRLAAIAVNNDTPMETILDVNMTIASPMAVLDEQDRVENATIIDARPDLSTT